jgi:D-glycero-alpha-D-manno-heptose-7-phosphate kinase
METRAPRTLIHARAPIRVNDIGGWTDTWFSGEGKVVNLAMSPRVEVEVAVFENSSCRKDRAHVHAVDYGDRFRVNPDAPGYDRHPLLEGALNSLPVPRDVDIEVTLRSHVPGGSSTGTSASVCVALLGALDRLTGPGRSREVIASLAHRVETEKLGLQSGIQDQLCAAHGGVSFIHMRDYPHADVESLALEEDLLADLNQRLDLIFLGCAHTSSELHKKVIALLENQSVGYEHLEALRRLADEAREALVNGDLEAYGEVMRQNNERQRSLHPDLISPEADRVTTIARNHGALGWKVNGAGGSGGSLTLLSGADADQRDRMIHEIEGLGKGITSIPVSLDRAGLEVWES